MAVITYATREFPHRMKEIATVYRRAFSGPPWFFTWTQEEALRFIDVAMHHEGFEAFLSLGKDGEVVGAQWYYPLRISEVASELCQELADFAKGQIQQHDLSILVYEKAIFIDPLHQGHGLARQLRETGLANASSLYNYQRRVLFLTRHREDNEAIVHLSEKMGFSDTGVTMQGTVPGLLHKFYYKITR